MYLPKKFIIIASFLLLFLGGVFSYVYLPEETENVDPSRLISSDPRIIEHLQYDEGSPERESIQTLENYFNLISRDYKFEDSLKFIEQESLDEETYQYLKQESEIPYTLLKYDLNEPFCSERENGEEYCYVEAFMKFDAFEGGMAEYQVVKKEDSWLIVFPNINDVIEEENS